jgi:hypothetical protein
MTDFPHERRRLFGQAALENWLVAVITALLAFIFLGIVPHMYW